MTITKTTFKQFLLRNKDFEKLTQLKADKVLKNVMGWGASWSSHFFYIFGYDFKNEQQNLKMVEELKKLGFKVYEGNYKAEQESNKKGYKRLFNVQLESVKEL